MSKKFRAMEETHMTGSISFDSVPSLNHKDDDFGIQIASDGRVWICINGISVLRFQPFKKDWRK